jgi:hypothetical protein
MHGHPRDYRGMAGLKWGLSTDVDEQMKQRIAAANRSYRSSCDKGQGAHV